MSNNLFRHGFVLLSVVALSTSLGCKKKESGKNSGTEAYTEIEKNFDKSEPAAAEKKPVAGADLTELDKTMTVVFESLADTLPSPCGKAHSLRTSRNTDTDCKRAPFAVDYVFGLIKDGASEAEVKEFYGLRFRDSKQISFSLNSASPHQGPTDASVKMVEFYDYGCPACARMKMVLDEVMKDYETEVVVYYKQFPLDSHPDSQGAAQGALAANKQGKFKEMHALLFANQHSHKQPELEKYAEEIGVDMAQWKSDQTAFKGAVDGEKGEGEKAGIEGTPALYINGRVYEGPMHPKYLKMWIAEALAEAI